MVDRRPSERGSVLILMPVAVLVIVILGAIAVDRAVVFGAQRELVQAAQAAANDAAATGADLDHLRNGSSSGGPARLDPTTVEQALRASLVGVEDLVDVRWSVRGNQVEVILERRVDHVFTRGVPGAAESTTVRATATATLVDGD